jgi:hypothetical protein
MIRSLILTSTINPVALDVKYIDVSNRRLEAINSVKFYAESKCYDRVIFVDNSNQSISTDVANYFKEKRVEFIEIIFQTSLDLYTEYDGYKFIGEIDSIKKVLSKVNFQSNEKIFKITARYIIKNHEEFVQRVYSSESAFIYFWPRGWQKSVYTSIYMTNVTQLNLLATNYEIYQKKYGSNMPIEKIFGIMIYENYSAKRILWRSFPEIDVISGTLGVIIKNKFSFKSMIQIFFATVFGTTFEEK